MIDLTQFVLGPYATQTLGDLGADVIKIEEPSGDRQRSGGKPPNSKTMGPLFVALNRNKRSVALDLKSEPGKRALRKLIATGDIFIHNMRPDTMARLGFSYDAVAAIKPDIVYVEAMGYAPEGPYAGRQAFDDLIQSAAGACGLTGMVDPDAVFRPLPSIIADKTCGLFATIATLAALRHKEHDRRGAVCLRADAGDLHRLSDGRAPLQRDLRAADRPLRPHHDHHPLSQAVEDEGRPPDGDAGQPGAGGAVHGPGRHPRRL